MLSLLSSTTEVFSMSHAYGSYRKELTLRAAAVFPLHQCSYLLNDIPRSAGTSDNIDSPQWVSPWRLGMKDKSLEQASYVPLRTSRAARLETYIRRHQQQQQQQQQKQQHSYRKRDNLRHRKRSTFCLRIQDS
jgi:hypothetical protein